MSRSSSRDAAPGIDAVDVTRRRLLQVGILGSVALGSASVGAGLSGCTARDAAAAQGYAVLRDADVVFFRALVPVVLERQMPAEPAKIDTVVRGIDATLHRVGPPARKAFVQLLDLLNMGLTRRFVAGVSVPWDQATSDQVRGFLDQWHGSRFAMLNASYRALIKLPPAVFYATAEGAAVAGYPGPPPAQFAALNS